VKIGELAFGEFRLDRANALLWRGHDRVVLPPKPFELLCCLVERAGELVTKDDLLDAVWSDVNVSDSSLSVAMNALRSALGDDRLAPHFIETVTRRGYRFIAPVTVARSSSVEPTREEEASAPAPAAHSRLRVGRDGPLEILDGVLQQVLIGKRQVVFVTGEAGIGKTTFVDMAMERMWRHGGGVLRCGCNELFGTHEAFLPLIEALQELCRGSDGPFLLKALRDHAPTWLAQMPGFLRVEDRAAFQHEIFGATRERMLREFSDLMEGLSVERPWVIILEDLHWSDFATVDVLSRVARRDRKAPILILATYRPMDVAIAGHPIRTVHQDLQIHGRCVELALDRLTLPEVEHYLALRFASADLVKTMVDRVFGRTDGQPLFVVSLVDHLIAQGAIVNADGQWQLKAEEAISHDDMPRDLQEMITRQIDRLTIDEQRLLETASAAGPEFSALVTAAALDRSILEVEQVCEALARTGQVLVQAGVAEWPNGVVSGRYAFRHALYQEVLYQRLAPGRRVDTHRRVGESLEQGYGAQAPEVASVLALHFELGHDFARAVHYLGLAAESSAQRFSTREAADYLTRALGLVDHLPADARSAARLKLLLQRGWAWRSGGDFVRSLQDVTEMIAYAVQTGNLRAEVNGLVDLSRFYLYVDRRQCLKLAEQALAKSRAIDDAAFGALAQGNVANLNLMLRGWRAEDADFCRQAVKLIAESHDLAMLVRRCSMESVLEFLSSDYRACCAATRRGRELARVIGDVYLFVLYNTVEAFALLYLGEWSEVQRSVAAALAITERNVNPQAGALCRLTIGWLQAESQDFEGAAKCAEEALDATVEANPFNFFIGRNLLAKAHIGLGNLSLARTHLDAIDRRIEAGGIEMESLITPQYFLNRCEYWLAAGDFDQARQAAARLHEITAEAPDRPFLALSHSSMARVAMAAGNTQEAKVQLSQAISIVRHAQFPLAAWRVYATAANFYDGVGEVEKAIKCRYRSGEVVRLLANSLQQSDPVRSAIFLARATGTQPAHKS
jgi:DNA-binding winged helix-turn-helix (wHTH) protein/tetratricopeptide (TPR) repeat protein